jgi:hypothetical protein
MINSAAKHQRRSISRDSVALPVLVHAQGKHHVAQLLNLSPAGAMLRTDAPIAVGVPVLLDCGAVVRPAIVKWHEGNFVGLRFEIDLDRHDLDGQVNRSSALEARLERRRSSPSTVEAPFQA